MPEPATYPRISIVIVNYNLAEYLETAIRSVVDQEYPNLELIVVDGGSTDGSVEIIRKYESAIHWWVSEPDGGHGPAIQKGFDKASGEIMAWLNSDDRYHHRALWEVGKIFQEFPQVRWLMGYPTEFEPGGASVNRIALPWTRWSKWRFWTYDFQFIMQEATFWRKDLWEEAGSRIDPETEIAVDLELWARFFRHAKLYTTMTLLGGFRHRGGEQRSYAARQTYLEEAGNIIKRERRRLSAGTRFRLHLQRILLFPWGILFFLDLPYFRRVYEWAYQLPPVIQYNFDHHRYLLSKRQVRHPNLYWKGRQVRRPVAKNPEKEA